MAPCWGLPWVRRQPRRLLHRLVPLCQLAPQEPRSSVFSLLPGNRMRCYDCGGGPSSSCKETVTTCGEGERCGFLERKPRNKPSGNRESSVFPLPLALPCFQNLPGSFWLWADGAAVRVEQSVAPSGSWHQAFQEPAVCVVPLPSPSSPESHGPFTHK